MVTLDTPERAITLGHPSYVWRSGQERRLRMVTETVSLQGRRVLDVGCGLGLYVHRFMELGAQAHGIEIDSERAHAALQVSPHIREGSAEELPYPDESFEVVFSNEVLEHVEDDERAISEAVRVLVPGGHLILFVPNRLYPFETHGWYWRGTYRFGNIPLINYLPDAVRNRLCPHVRAYTRRGLGKLFADQPGEIVVHRGIYPGYDNVVKRWPRVGRWIRWLSYRFEATPFQWLGLSHFVVFRKAD